MFLIFSFAFLFVFSPTLLQKYVFCQQNTFCRKSRFFLQKVLFAMGPVINPLLRAPFKMGPVKRCPCAAKNTKKISGKPMTICRQYIHSEHENAQKTCRNAHKIRTNTQQNREEMWNNCGKMRGSVKRKSRKKYERVC